MKKLLLGLLLAACTTCIFAQAVPPPREGSGGRGNEVSYDTSYIKRTATTWPKFAEYRTQRFNSGKDEFVTRTSIGDSLTTLNWYYRNTLEAARDLAEAGRKTILRSEVINPVFTADKGIRDSLGAAMSLFIKLYTNVGSGYIASDWTWQIAGGSTYTGTSISDHGTTYLFLTINSVTYQMYVLCETLFRIKDYPSSGTDTDMFWIAPNTFRSLTGTYKMTR